MSIIEKLSIQGIRSFGPNSEDCQSIAFSTPVTLILGENGCGKTTIIECLKYALTGDPPPGSERGKNFVHDPKIFNVIETLGQIKIQVRDKKNMRISLCRSMKVLDRGGKSTFSTLENTINFLNGSGNKDINSISQRCVDVDLVMCEFMGVSKAIINNVLFCHQEDSSWPLDESKKLKDKFDAIFGITDYNKVVERAIKMRKIMADELKVMESDLKFMAHLKKEMEDKTLTLQNAEKKKESIEKLCNRCDEETKPIDSRLSEIRKIEYEIGKYQEQKVESETKYKNCCEQITNLKKKIKIPLEGTLQDIEFEINSFDEQMREKNKDLAILSTDLDKLKIKEKSTQNTIVEIEKKIFITVEQFQREQNCKKKYVQEINSLCIKLDIQQKEDLYENPNTIPEILELIQTMLLNKKVEIVKITNESETDDLQRQSEIDLLRVDITKSEEGITLLQKQQNSFENELETAKNKIHSINNSTQQLENLSKKLQESDEMYNNVLKNFDQESCRAIIANNKVSIAKLQDQFIKIDKEITFQNSIAKVIAEIDLKQHELEKKEHEVHRIKSKHSDKFLSVFPTPVTGNYRSTLQIIYEKLREYCKEVFGKANSQKLKEQSLQIQRKSFKNEIDRLTKDLDKSEEIIFQQCYSKPYDDLLARCKAEVLRLQLDHGALKSAEAMYKKYLEKLNSETCCPLCHKNMTNNEIFDLLSELNDEIQKLPGNIKRIENTLQIEQSKFDNLMQLKPTIEKLDRLKIDIFERKTNLEKVEQMLSETSNEHEKLQTQLAKATRDMDLANSMFGDMSLLDEALKEISRTQKDLENLKLKLPKNHNSRNTTENLEKEKSNISKALEAERKTLEENQQNYEKQSETLNRIRENKNRIKENQISLQEGLHTLPQLQARRNELLQLLINIKIEISELQCKIKPLNQKLNIALADKTSQKELYRQKIHIIQLDYDSYEKSNQEIQRLAKELSKYKEQNLKSVLEKHNELKNETLENLNKLVDEISEKSVKLEALKMDCVNQETLERNLKDNRELKLLKQKEIELKQLCESLSKQLCTLNFENIMKEKNNLIEMRDEYTVRKSELLGQIGEINNQIQNLKKTINEPKYKESIENYRRANYNVLISRRMISDLGQYCVALEWSLIQFHAEKMEKINALIREYWRLIYRGNDIDYIQIKTDDGNNIKASADRKRNYNYRVVQSKNCTEIEMRGRCSAGQRVLASLIIRMALAETFSSSCGVLALDEPTTNLDKFNILSLCDALNRIVEDRHIQSNFMLIIITHDEDFISALGKINTYHRVYRNDEGKSVIRKVNIT